MGCQQCAGATGPGSGWDADSRVKAQAGLEMAGMREEAACLRAEQMSLGARLTRACNAASNAQRNGQALPRGVDPALARAFTRAWAGLWVSTGPCQHFYRKEFDLAHQRDGRLAQTRHRVDARLAPTHGEDVRQSTDVLAEQVSSDALAWLKTISETGHRGWHFRAARDAMSLVGNLSLLAIVAACFYREHQADDEPTGDPAARMSAANTPFGVPWADWTLLAFEGAKGVLTQSLGSPTLIRHHAVDEVLKRMDAGCRLLEACVMLPASPRTSPWRDTLGTLTRARDVATLFTFANSAVPPTRFALWIPSWFSGPSETRDGYRGLLRVAGLMLDSCRAVTSLLGTWARNEAFTIDANGLAQRWEALCARLAAVPAEDVATVLDRVEAVTQLAALCDTPLLAKIASLSMLRERLLVSGGSLTADQIAVECAALQVPCHASRVDGASRLSLNPGESPWGHRWNGEAWQIGAATPARASYRLLLLYQHWSAALLERAVSASIAEKQEAVSSQDDRSRAGRTRSSVAYIDIESTRV
ncbi:hypothetical protein [Pandoraea pulmonicola]|nr:hypothetical protein [Pandoraea pulmonicola]